MRSFRGFMMRVSGCIGINDTMDGTYKIFASSKVAIEADGEIVVSGDCVMKGYDKDEAYTKRVIRDGVYHTGDIGRINDKGRLVLLKRNPEIILLPTGEKISRTVTIRQISALDGVAESYVTLNDRASHSRYFSELDAQFFVKKRTYVYRIRYPWYNLFIAQNKT